MGKKKNKKKLGYGMGKKNIIKYQDMVWVEKK